MAIPFSHTLQALMADSMYRSRAGIAAIVIVVSAWFTWFLFAEIGIYKTAPARIQAEGEIHVVETLIDGRVVTINMTVGKEVHAGDILVELEDTAVRLKLAELSALLDSAHAQQRAINASIAAEERALTNVQGGSPMAQAEAKHRYEQAKANAVLAEKELERWRKLHESGFVAELPVLERETTLLRRRSETEELRLAITRQGKDRRADEADRHASIERLRRDAAELVGFIDSTTKIVQQTEYENRHYLLRAPVNGSLSEVAELRPGMMVRSGERLATILPSGELKMLADFTPTAIGHIRPGQPAWLRLEGFPWGQYGRVKATVVRVAREPRIGKIHVELSLPSRHATIPLQHGLLGIVEVEVDRASPAVLILRAAGALLRSDTADAGT